MTAVGENDNLHLKLCLFLFDISLMAARDGLNINAIRGYLFADTTVRCIVLLILAIYFRHRSFTSNHFP